MNERIKELYKEATGKDWAYDFDPQIAENFAELIVRECADVADQNGGFWRGCGMTVKQHFGVEEGTNESKNFTNNR